jgi:copper chaperone NosL
VADRRGARLRAAIAAAVALAAVALLARALLEARRPPDGPIEVAWDRATCAHCGMLVSDPAFAAQLHTTTGDVAMFDDPGCLLRFERDHAPGVHARWFHHYTENRWIDGDHVRFLSAPGSPMGYGLAAIDAETVGALSLEQARDRVLAQAIAPETREQ